MMATRNRKDWPEALAEYQKFAQHIRKHAQNAKNMILDDMVRTARLAGIDSSIAGLHAHNAMCALADGKPWREVNYSLVRRVLYLEKKSFRPEELADRIMLREYSKLAERFNLAR